MRCFLRASAIVSALLTTAACDRGLAPEMKPGEFLISTLSAPPGRTLKKTFGFYCRWFSYAAGADYGAAFTQANVALKTEGEKIGANAFINFSAAAVPPTDAKSSAGAVVMLCGDFAELK
jgi:hypothetical protein